MLLGLAWFMVYINCSAAQPTAPADDTEYKTFQQKYYVGMQNKLYENSCRILSTRKII